MTPRGTAATGRSALLGPPRLPGAAALCLLLLTGTIASPALGLWHAGEGGGSAVRGQALSGTALGGSGGAGRGSVGAGQGGGSGAGATSVAGGGVGRRRLRQRGLSSGASTPERHLGVVSVLETVNSTQLAPAWLDAALGALSLSGGGSSGQTKGGPGSGEQGSGGEAPLLTCGAHWECPALRPCQLRGGRGGAAAGEEGQDGAGAGAGEGEGEGEIEACAVPLAHPSGGSGAASGEASRVRQLLTGESAKPQQVLPGGAVLSFPSLTPDATSPSPACAASPSSAPGAMLFLLSNVFVDAQGNVFDRRHWYHSTGGGARPFLHCRGTQAAAYDKVLFLLPSTGRGPSAGANPTSEEAPASEGSCTDSGASRGRHGGGQGRGRPWVYQRLVEDLVPMVYTLGPVLAQLRSEYRWLLPPSRHLRHLSADMFGIDLSSRALHLHQAAATHPIFVRQLLVPVLSQCGQWRQQLWDTIRQRHLLPFQGFPLFFSNWTANPAPGAPAPRHSPFPPDWVALYAPGVAAARPGQDAALRAALLAAGVPPERVMLMEPSAKLHQMKEVLNRAVLLVGPTSATLPHVIFMPPGAVLLEVLARGADMAPEGPGGQGGRTRSLEEQGEEEPRPVAQRPSALPSASSVLHLSLLCPQAQQGPGKSEGADAGAQERSPPGACSPDDLSAAVRAALEGLAASAPELGLSPTSGSGSGSASPASSEAAESPPDLMTMSLQPYELDEAHWEVRAKQAAAGPPKKTSLLGLVIPDQNASLDLGGGQIRGSRLRDAGSVAGFQEWMRCIGREGRWEYNATPRSLPWEYTGYTNLCDHRLEDGGLGVASKRAEELVQRGVDAAGWNVRDSLKYNWVVDEDKCKAPDADAGTGAGAGGAGREGEGPAQAYVRYDGADFCARMRRYAERRDAEEEARGAVPQWRRKGSFGILIVGDSIQQQLAATLANHLLWHARKEQAGWAQWGVNKSECFSWVPHAPHEHCRRYDFHPDACPGVTMHFVSNRWLHLLDPFAVKESVPWSEYAGLVEADVIIVNRGAHYTSDELYAQDVNHALHFLRRNFPDKLVLYRSTPPGHHNCSTASRPLAHPQQAADLQRLFEGYHWDAFAGQNEIARRLAAQYGVAFMDVVPMMELRADGHRSWMEGSDRDCLHYCTPGPVDVMVEVLYNTLLRLLFREPTSAQGAS